MVISIGRVSKDYAVRACGWARDQVSSSLFSLSSDLIQPIWTAHLLHNKITRPIHPGEWDQASTRTREIFLRVCRALLLPPLIVMGIPLMPAGVLLQVAAGFVQKTPFYHLHTSCKEKTLPTDRRFSLASWNICAMWGGHAMTSGGVLPWKDRIKAIGEKICQEDSDIIGLQELHDIQAMKALFPIIRKKYSHIYYNMGAVSNPSVVNSGLCVCSKYKLENVQFHPFGAKTLVGSAQHVNKGWVSFDVKNGKETFAHMAYTHLQHSKHDAAPSSEELHCREQEVLAIKQEFSKHPLYGKIPFFLGGDLNLYGKEAERVIPRREFVNPYLQNKASTPTWFGHRLESQLFETPEEPLGKKPFIIDHIVAVRKGPLSYFQVEKKDVEQGYKYPLSDHHMLLARVRLTFSGSRIKNLLHAMGFYRGVAVTK